MITKEFILNRTDEEVGRHADYLETIIDGYLYYYNGSPLVIEKSRILLNCPITLADAVCDTIVNRYTKSGGWSVENNNTSLIFS